MSVKKHAEISFKNDASGGVEQISILMLTYLNQLSGWVVKAVLQLELPRLLCQSIWLWFVQAWIRLSFAAIYAHILQGWFSLWRSGFYFQKFSKIQKYMKHCTFTTICRCYCARKSCQLAHNYHINIIRCSNTISWITRNIKTFSRNNYRAIRIHHSIWYYGNVANCKNIK